MKRTFQWATAFTVAASMTALAQPQGAPSARRPAGPSQGQPVTLQGCLQSGAGSADTAPSTSSTGSTATGSTSTGSTGAAGSTSAAAGTQGATAQSGQAAGAGRMGGYASSAAASMYTLRVTDGGSGRAPACRRRQGRPMSGQRPASRVVACTT